MTPDRKNPVLGHQLDLLDGLETLPSAPLPPDHPQRRGAVTPRLRSARRIHATGAELKEEGMRRALEAKAVQEWKERFRRAVRDLAVSGKQFSSEEAVDRSGGLPREAQMNANNAVGAMMNGLAKQGFIRKTGFRVRSLRPSSHGAELALWQGVPDAAH